MAMVFGQANSKSMKEAATKAGINVVDEEAYQAASPDYKALLQRVAAASTGFSAAEFPTEKGAGKYAEYTFSVSQWLPQAKWAGSKEFDEAYFKLSGSHCD